MNHKDRWAGIEYKNMKPYCMAVVKVWNFTLFKTVFMFFSFIRSTGGGQVLARLWRVERWMFDVQRSSFNNTSFIQESSIPAEAGSSLRSDKHQASSIAYHQAYRLPSNRPVAWASPPPLGASIFQTPPIFCPLSP